MVRNSESVRIVALGLVLITAVFWIASCSPGTNKNSTNVNTSVNANTAGKTCDSSTDRGIEAAFNSSLSNNPVLAPQMQHINYFSINCVLSLQGWADSVTDFKSVLDIAQSTPNVVSVNFEAFWVGPDHTQRPAPGGICEPGFKQWGDFCIPEQDKCSIKSGMNSANSTNKR